jgi:hypothetical protein
MNLLTEQIREYLRGKWEALSEAKKAAAPTAPATPKKPEEYRGVSGTQARGWKNTIDPEKTGPYRDGPTTAETLEKTKIGTQVTVKNRHAEGSITGSYLGNHPFQNGRHFVDGGPSVGRHTFHNDDLTHIDGKPHTPGNVIHNPRGDKVEGDPEAGTPIHITQRRKTGTSSTKVMVPDKEGNEKEKTVKSDVYSNVAVKGTYVGRHSHSGHHIMTDESGKEHKFHGSQLTHVKGRKVDHAKVLPPPGDPAGVKDGSHALDKSNAEWKRSGGSERPAKKKTPEKTPDSSFGTL